MVRQEFDENKALALRGPRFPTEEESGYPQEGMRRPKGIERNYLVLPPLKDLEDWVRIDPSMQQAEGAIEEGRGLEKLQALGLVAFYELVKNPTILPPSLIKRYRWRKEFVGARDLNLWWLTYEITLQKLVEGLNTGEINQDYYRAVGPLLGENRLFPTPHSFLPHNRWLFLRLMGDPRLDRLEEELQGIKVRTQGIWYSPLFVGLMGARNAEVNRAVRKGLFGETDYAEKFAELLGEVRKIATLEAESKEELKIKEEAERVIALAEGAPLVPGRRDPYVFWEMARILGARPDQPPPFIVELGKNIAGSPVFNENTWRVLKACKLVVTDNRLPIESYVGSRFVGGIKTKDGIYKRGDMAVLLGELTHPGISHYLAALAGIEDYYLEDELLDEADERIYQKIGGASTTPLKSLQRIRGEIDRDWRNTPLIIQLAFVDEFPLIRDALTADIIGDVHGSAGKTVEFLMGRKFDLGEFLVKRFNRLIKRAREEEMPAEELHETYKFYFWMLAGLALYKADRAQTEVEAEEARVAAKRFCECASKLVYRYYESHTIGDAKLLDEQLSERERRRQTPDLTTGRAVRAAAKLKVEEAAAEEREILPSVDEVEKRYLVNDYNTLVVIYRLTSELLKRHIGQGVGLKPKDFGPILTNEALNAFYVKIQRKANTLLGETPARGILNLIRVIVMDAPEPSRKKFRELIGRILAQCIKERVRRVVPSVWPNVQETGGVGMGVYGRPGHLKTETAFITNRPVFDLKFNPIIYGLGKCGSSASDRREIFRGLCYHVSRWVLSLDDRSPHKYGEIVEFMRRRVTGQIRPEPELMEMLRPYAPELIVVLSALSDAVGFTEAGEPQELLPVPIERAIEYWALIGLLRLSLGFPPGGLFERYKEFVPPQP